MSERLVLQQGGVSADVDLLHSKLRVLRATTASELDAVFSLRHRSYLKEGAIARRSDARLYDIFDEPGCSLIFGVYDDGGIVASIRLQVLSEREPNSPSAMAFPDIVEPLLEQGKRLLDPTRFVIASDASKRYPALAYFVLRLPFIAAEHFVADVALAAVRSEHMPFYRRVLRYEKAAEPRPYLHLTKPLGLMAADYWRERAAVVARFPFFRARTWEHAHLFDEEVTVG
jgi:hypothetical protein